MRRKTQVWILVIWILGQILSTLCIEKKYADPMQNVTILQRHRRSRNIFAYFDLLDRKVTSRRRYDNNEARRFMRFSGRRVQVGNQIVTKLTCDITRHTNELINGVGGVLILHKRHQRNKRLTEVVGLTSNGNILFNKQLNWKMKINQKSTASRAAEQKLGYGRLDYYIPGDKCNIQAGLFYCKIYGNRKPFYQFQRQHGVSKAQCKRKITAKKKSGNVMLILLILAPIVSLSLIIIGVYITWFTLKKRDQPQRQRRR